MSPDPSVSSTFIYAVYIHRRLKYVNVAAKLTRDSILDATLQLAEQRASTP